MGNCCQGKPSQVVGKMWKQVGGDNVRNGGRQKEREAEITINVKTWCFPSRTRSNLWLLDCVELKAK